MLGCSKDDTSEPSKNELLGKWELVSSSDAQYWKKPCIFNFRENNMLTITFAKGTINEEAVPCRYTTSGSYIEIDFGYGDDIYEGTYKINKNVLTFDMISYDPDEPEDVYEDFLTLRRID